MMERKSRSERSSTTRRTKEILTLRMRRGKANRKRRYEDKKCGVCLKPTYFPACRNCQCAIVERLADTKQETRHSA